MPRQHSSHARQQAALTVVVVVVVVCATALARADGWGLQTTHLFWDRATPRSYGSFRLGMAGGAMNFSGSVWTGASARPPEMCLELFPLPFVSAEACGNGSGFLHHNPAPEIAHFHAKLGVASLHTRGAWLQPQLALGFAELQVGEDESGFSFDGASASRNSTTGPEAGASLRGVVALTDRLELMVDLRASLAYFAHARSLSVPQQRWQPTAALSIGVGL